MWVLGAPVGGYRVFIMQRGTSEGAEFLVLVGWGGRSVTSLRGCVRAGKWSQSTGQVGVCVMGCKTRKMLGLSFSRSGQKVRMEGRG